MNILLNGETKALPETMTALELLDHLQLTGKRLALELNGHIIPRSMFAQTQINENDTIEIVHAIGGG